MKKALGTALLLGAAWMGAVAAHANEQVAVSDAWARATVPGTDSSAAFLKLKSPADAVLKSVDSPAAATVEMHEMRMDGSVMRMRAVREVQVPAGRTVEFSPDGYHIMLTGMKKPLKTGDSLPLKLHLLGKDGKTQDVAVQAKVVGIGDSAPFAKAGGSSGMGRMGGMPMH